jgi:hypothetical protein
MSLNGLSEERMLRSVENLTNGKEKRWRESCLESLSRAQD